MDKWIVCTQMHNVLVHRLLQMQSTKEKQQLREEKAQAEKRLSVQQ
jgi:hypothetical protein